VLYAAERLASDELSDVLRKSPFVITVGDRVTDFAHEVGRNPDVQVVDGVERRQRRLAPVVPFSRLLKVRNPAGAITPEAIVAVKRAMSGRKPVRILVEGEEDLLAIPAVEEAPMGSTLLYGQPGLGVVLLLVDERAKTSVREMLSEMGRAPHPR